MSSPIVVDYSIIICTYNPDERLLKRCLDAVAAFNIQDVRVETIIVDNNSDIPLSGLDYVSGFLENTMNSSLIEVKQQGLNYARIGGLKAARGKWLVFFDDDNEPDANYIITLNDLDSAYPHVAAWGPGRVAVEFIEGVEAHLESYAREAFQERNEKDIVYSNQQSFQSCYPYGTGLCLRKYYFEMYAVLADAGHFSIVGRNGNQLSSGEDTQVIFFCLSKGMAAGVAPELKLSHLVPGKRTKFNYLKRLTFGTCVGYSTCRLEVFPEYKAELLGRVMPSGRFAFKAVKKYCLLFFKRKPRKAFALVEYLASICGDYRALNLKVPSIVNVILRKLKAI